MAHLFQNNLSGFLTSGINTSVTSLNVDFGSVVPDSNVSTSSPMYLTLIGRNNTFKETSWEVVQCTGFVAQPSVGPGHYVVTVIRGASPLSFNAGNDLIENRLTAEAVNTYETIESVAHTWTELNMFTGGLESEGAGINSFRAGDDAGATTQGEQAVAIGYLAGQSAQEKNAIAIGFNTGRVGQQENSVAVGAASGNDNQGLNAVAVGYGSGGLNQGNYSVAIGNLAATNGQGNNGLIISSKGAAVQDTTQGHIHIASDDGSIDFTTANGWTATDSAGTFDLKSTVGKIGDVFQGKNDGDPIIMTWVGNSNTGGYMTTAMTAGTLVANPNVLIWQASSIESHSCQWETADHDENNFITGMALTNDRMCGFIKGQHVSPALAAANKMQELFNVRVYLIMTYQGGCPSDLVNPNLSDAIFGSVDPAIDSEYDFTGNYSGNNNMWWFHSTAVNDALTSIQAGTNGATAYDQDYVDFVGDTLGQGDALLSTTLINNRTIEEAEIMYVENMTAFVHAAEGTTPILDYDASNLDPSSIDANLIVSVANGGWAKNQHTKWFSIDMPAGSRGIFGIAAVLTILMACLNTQKSLKIFTEVLLHRLAVDFLF